MVQILHGRATIAAPITNWGKNPAKPGILNRQGYFQKFFGVWPFFAKKGQNLGALFIKSAPNPVKIFLQEKTFKTISKPALKPSHGST